MSTISGTTSYMSNDAIQAWMTQKNEELYTNLRESMDTSNTRADTQKALNHVKNAFMDAKNNGGDVTAIYGEIDSMLEQYGDIPEVAQALNDIKNSGPYQKYQTDLTNWKSQCRDRSQGYDSNPTTEGKKALDALLASPPKATVSDGQADTWNKTLGDVVDGLGKTDQLAMISINDLISRIHNNENQASAMMDSSNSTSQSIINRIG